MLAHSKIMPTFASLSQRTYRVLSSAGSEHLPYKQRVGGSNPSAPTQVEISVNPERCAPGIIFVIIRLAALKVRAAPAAGVPILVF